MMILDSSWTQDLTNTKISVATFKNGLMTSIVTGKFKMFYFTCSTLFIYHVERSFDIEQTKLYRVGIWQSFCIFGRRRKNKLVMSCAKFNYIPLYWVWYMYRARHSSSPDCCQVSVRAKCMCCTELSGNLYHPC